MLGDEKSKNNKPEGNGKTKKFNGAFVLGFSYLL
jgi:hypothetical protein